MEELGIGKANWNYAIDPYRESMTSAANAELGVPLRIADIKLRPWYRRSYSLGDASPSDSYMDDVARASYLARDARYAYTFFPWVELWEPSVRRVFEEASEGLDLASFAAETGLEASRPTASAWYDLLVPGQAGISYKRELSQNADSVSEAGVVSVNALSSAINIFGNFGSYPIFTFYDDDEFFSRAELVLRMPREESTVLPTVSHLFAGRFISGGEARFLNVENRVRYEGTRDGPVWSESLTCSYSIKSERTWLSAIVSLVFPRKSDIREAERTEGDTGPSYVSAFIDELASKKPMCTDEFGISVAYSNPDADGSVRKLEFKERYESRFVVPERFSFSTALSLSELFDRSDDRSLFALGYELSITARIIF
jgi:hypothetical protein